jgi:general nucleoside transport system ATP-binding protein
MKSLCLSEISKQFGSVKANDAISIDIRQGTVHAIVGENGAGKSTLMNIIYGLYQPDSGKIYIDDKQVEITSPIDAISRHIGMVHQHFKLVSCFTVTQNIILGEEITKNFNILDNKKAEQIVQELSDTYKLSVDPKATISEISVGMEQRVEILKCLYRKAEILILDEPTAVLTPQEIDDLLNIIQDLKKKGKTIIFITHKLKEVKKIADDVTVIRRGKVVGSSSVEDMSIERMAELMVGETLEELNIERAHNAAETLLEIKNISYKDKRGVKRLKNISLKVKRGEILGIAGVDGNGQSELIDMIVGIIKPGKGNIVLENEIITHTDIKSRRKKGICHIPEDRHRHGLVMDFILKENLVLGIHRRADFTKFGVLRPKNIADTASRLIEEFDIRPRNINLAARSMSGGNQQKAIIAREVYSDPVLILAVQPTRGLDIGAIRFVRKQLVDLRDKGRAVLLVSLDLDEIMALSDRIAVINNGRIVGEAIPESITRKELGVMMAGIDNSGKGKSA